MKQHFQQQRHSVEPPPSEVSRNTLVSGGVRVTKSQTISSPLPCQELGGVHRLAAGSDLERSKKAAKIQSALKT